MRVIFVDYIRSSVELGRANMVAKPSVGERVMLDSGVGAVRFMQFEVKLIEHDAKNTMQVEDWMHPYERSVEAGAVIVHVAGLTSETREYVDRVIARADRKPAAE